MSEFLAMGGYASFVWGAYGVSALVLIYNFMTARSYERRQHTQARAQQQRAQR